MARFALALVAVDAYEHYEDLPSTETAARIQRLLEPCGVESVRRPASTDSAADLVEFLDGWATDADGPGGTLLYWVGHGSREGQHAWLLAGQSKSPLSASRAVDAGTLADMVRTRWIERTAGEGSWTVLVLDCCRGRDAGTAIVNALTADPGSRPDQVAIVEVGGNSAAEVGRFADALEASLAGFTENDAVISLRSLLFAVTDRLGVQPTIWLTREAAIDNPRATPAVLTVSQDLVEEWRTAVEALDREVRDHFLRKAQSTELGEFGWYFVGRRDECTALAKWLRDKTSGMLVVTGEPGAGKSALLGRFVALADSAVADVLDRGGLLAGDDADRPEPGAFDAVVHLTGKTPHDVRTALERAVPELRIRDAQVSIEKPDGPLTILVDALDEAQSPFDIVYDVLRPLAGHPGVRLVVGSRRSLDEGPDQPLARHAELLDALGVDERNALVLNREPAAMAAYARDRLAAEAPHLDRKLVAHIVERAGSVDQPFLFARLAMYELLARADQLDLETVDTILSGRHGDVFALAVDRLGRGESSTAQLLRGLAYAHGRGLPRHDGVWAAVTGALFPDNPVGESEITQALVDAAPYIVLDGEHGQSAHRLAHKTFAERFHADDPDLAASHAAIADRLMERVAELGWPQANPYFLAYLPRHAARSPQRLDKVCGDPGWLSATLSRFGIDDTLSIFDAMAVGDRTPATTRIQGAVRRARVALARDPDQLAAQLHARLRDEDDAALQSLVERLPSIAPSTWLRVTEGGAEWTSSTDSTMTFDAKIRAVAAGRLDGRPTILVGAGDSVATWDPASGHTEELVRTEGERITALALGTVEGQDVVAAGAMYDGTITVFPAGGGAPLLRLTDTDCQHVAVGMISGRPAVVRAGYDLVRVCTLEGQDVASIPVDAGVLAIGIEGGALTMLLDHPEGLRVHRAEDGFDRILDGATSGVAHALVEIDGGMVAVIAQRETVEAWHADSGRLLGRIEADPGFAVRTATALVVGDSLRFAAGNDTDFEGGYVLLRSPGERPTRGRANPQLERAVAVSPAAGLALTLDDDRAVLFDPRNADPVAAGVDSGDLADVFGPTIPTSLPDTERLRLGPTGPVEKRDGGGQVGGTLSLFQRGVSRLHISRPGDWPVNARAFGRLDGRPVVATGHVSGVCWLWGAETGAVVAGPFGAVAEEITDPLGIAKGGPQPTTDVSYLEGASGAFLARVNEAEVAGWDVRSGRRLGFTDIPGSEATAVALGIVDDRVVLARGAAGGAISIWSVDDGQRLCGLVLDSGIRRLWFDHATPTLVVLTTDGVLHVADLVA